jgi:hypothetical protein
VVVDLAWREISALAESGIEGDNADRLRDELAKTIIAARKMEPTMIKETVLYKIRTRRFGRLGQKASASCSISSGERVGQSCVSRKQRLTD